MLSGESTSISRRDKRQLTCASWIWWRGLRKRRSHDCPGWDLERVRISYFERTMCVVTKTTMNIKLVVKPACLHTLRSTFGHHCCFSWSGCLLRVQSSWSSRSVFAHSPVNTVVQTSCVSLRLVVFHIVRVRPNRSESFVVDCSGNAPRSARRCVCRCSVTADAQWNLGLEARLVRRFGGRAPEARRAECEYRLQTHLCEYGKLVRRFNFGVPARAVYKLAKAQRRRSKLF